MSAQGAKSKQSFRERFVAWWEGYELEASTGQPALQVPSHDVRYQPDQPHWETARLRLVQQVWGEGFSTPGQESHILNMIKFFGLDPAMSVLDLGAGLGGATRIMSEKFGVWVTGLESDPHLAEAGMGLSTKAGMAKKAPILAFDPAEFEQKPNSVDCVFSKEFLYTVKDKEAFLKAIENALKSRGQLLFTDYVLAKAHLRSSAIDKWLKHEHRESHLWSVEDYQEALAKLHLDIRVTQDITTSHHKMVTQAWADYMMAARKSGIDEEVAPALVDELELWTRRMQAIDAGDLKVCRVHVLKKDTTRLMSNW